MTNPVKTDSPEKNKPRKGKKGKTTKQLMDLHLKDKGHKITDEDIASLDLNLDHPEKPLPPELIVPSEDDRPEEEKKATDKELENKKITPWDVIGG